jgi:hypothetical protein
MFQRFLNSSITQLPTVFTIRGDKRVEPCDSKKKEPNRDREVKEDVVGTVGIENVFNGNQGIMQLLEEVAFLMK